MLYRVDLTMSQLNSQRYWCFWLRDKQVITYILNLIFLAQMILHCSYFYILVFSNVILCEYQSVYIGCTCPSRIYVSEAIYGRTTDRNICPHSANKSTHCRSTTSDRKVKALCNGKRICRLKQKTEPMEIHVREHTNIWKLNIHALKIKNI